MGQESHHCENS